MSCSRFFHAFPGPRRCRASARRFLRGWFAATAALAAASCLTLGASSCRRSQTAAPPARRLAILPFEDQSSASGAAWLARLAPFSLRRQLESVPLLQAAEVRTAADFPGATHELSGYFAARQDRLEAHLFLYELPSHRLKHHVLLARPATEWRGLLEDAAGFITTSLRTAGTLNPPSVNTDAAARSLAQALAARTPADAIAAFRAAANADPACGWCWLGWAEAVASFEGREAALAVLEASARHRDSLDPLSRSRLDLLSAGLRRDRLAAASALQKIGAASPSDPLIQLQLSESLVAGRNYAQAEVRSEERPRHGAGPRALVELLAYALAYQGRYEQALEAVGRYAALDAGPILRTAAAKFS